MRHRILTLFPYGEPSSKCPQLRRVAALICTAGLLVTFVTFDCHAACNIIPPARHGFLSTQSRVDRPYARPGDWIEMTLDPACNATSPGFASRAADNVVTVIFDPPANGSPTAIVLRSDCNGFDSSPQKAACEGQLGAGGAAICIETTTTGPVVDLAVTGTTALRVRFPDTDTLLGLCVGGTNNGKVCRGDAMCPSGTCSGGQNDDLTLTGPITIVATAVGEPLACARACASESGVRACADTLFANDGTVCGHHPHATFPRLTALPPPNDYQALCTTPSSPCTGLADDIRMTVDAAGNLLVPMMWRGILIGGHCYGGTLDGQPCTGEGQCPGATCRGGGSPVARLLRASINAEAYATRRVPLLIPDPTALSSYSNDGIALGPQFDPQQDPSVTSNATLFGTADGAETVLRIARHPGPQTQCVGGSNDSLPCLVNADCAGGTCAPPECVDGSAQGAPCSDDAECPGGTCGPPLFDFSDRLVGDIGPVALRLNHCLGGVNELEACANDSACPGGQCVSFNLGALDPVPADGIMLSENSSSYVMEEAIENRDLNGDGDRTDHVAKFADRLTGAIEPIGAGVAEGRAVVRVQQPPFSFPAVAADGDMLAILESEPAQYATPTNGDYDRFDSFAQVFRLGAGKISTGTFAVDAAPRINGRAVMVSGGRAFYRRSEAAQARLITMTKSVSGVVGFGLSLSGEGRYLAFETDAPINGANICLGYFFNPSDPCPDVFVTSFPDGATVPISVSTSGTLGNGRSGWASISDDGRFVAFGSDATNLVAGDTNGVRDVFVRDRDTDNDGIFDEAGAVSTVRVLEGMPNAPSISADGRHVASGGIYDRLTATTAPGLVSTNGASVISGNGRYVAANVSGHIFVLDRDADEDGVFDETGAPTTTQVDVSNNGDPADIESTHGPAISADGRYVLFTSYASNLVTGDTNTGFDAFVHDRLTRTTRRVSMPSDGSQAIGATFFEAGEQGFGIRALSADGHFAAFDSQASDLVPGDTNANWDGFVHDTFTGMTERSSVSTTGGQLLGGHDMTISSDGRYVAFHSLGGELMIRGPDPADTAADTFADGVLDDVVLEAMDGSGLRTTLCPATDVSVARGRATFLRPESANGTVACPGGRLNTDAGTGEAPDDVSDTVVQLWTGTGSVLNLGRAAAAVALNDNWVAALVSEAGDAANYNAGSGDTDQSDTVAQVHPVVSGSWRNLGQAADAIGAAGNVVAFTTPEAAQGAAGTDLNNDGDIKDRVLRVWVPGAVQELNDTRLAAEEFVVGDSGVVAFRTLECDQGGGSVTNGCSDPGGATDLNRDGDAADGVLQIFDPTTLEVLNSELAVEPCFLEACDPRIPYRVLGNTVRFLTLEARQNHDLNGDGDKEDLVLEVLNVRQAGSGGPPLLPNRALAAAPAGVCTDTGESCVTDSSCPLGVCFVPPGGCIRDLGTPCDPTNRATCGTDEFCKPVIGVPYLGTCQKLEGPCETDLQCTAPAVCTPGSAALNRLADPMRRQDGGSLSFTGTGRCVEDFGASCTLTSDCPTGAYCNGGTCKREHGACETTGECPPGASCLQDLVTKSVRDTDGDELPDVIDNCPAVPNILQEDADADGVGDACDAETCGNSVREGSEACDRADVGACANGCTPLCTCAPPTQTCGNGIREGSEQCDGTDAGACGNRCTVLCACAPPAEILISGKKLVVRDNADPSRRKIVFQSKDIAIETSAGGIDPVGDGAFLQVYNPVTGDSFCQVLPAAAWAAKGTPPSYSYRDKDAVNGPCKLVSVKNQKLLKFSCDAKLATISYSLDEPSQGSISVRFGSGTTTYCTTFGGTVLADRSGRDFNAKDAAAPVSCPAPLTACP